MDFQAAFSIYIISLQCRYFGVLCCVKLYSSSLAVRKSVKSFSWTQAHLLTQTLEALVVKSLHLCQINLKAGSRVTEGVKWRRRAQRECLHKPCFHREPGKTYTDWKKKFSMGLCSGWEVLHLWLLPARGHEALKPALVPAVWTQWKGDGEQETPKMRIFFFWH